MKALVLDRPGRPETLRIAEMPKPKPGPGEMLVRVHAVGLNHVDYKLAAVGLPVWRYPFILGMDVAGKVDELGPGVVNWRAGDPVYYHGDLSRPGGYAEWTVVAAHVVAPMPEGLSFSQAAALPCTGFTAYQALHHKLHIEPGQTILVHGAAGGVGGFSVQLAALSGLQVIATCISKNFDHVQSLGAGEAIDFENEDIPAKVRSLTNGRGVDAIIDPLGSESATIGLGLLAFGGGIVCLVGFPDCSRIKPVGQALSIHRVALGGAYLSGDRKAQEELALIGRGFGQLVGGKKLNPMLQEEIALEGIPEALLRLSKYQVLRGKIVAKIL